VNGRITFRGIFWVLIALVLVAHIAGGWMLSNRIIREGFTPDPAPVVVPSGDFELEEITYDTPLGQMDAWYLPAQGNTWVIHVHDLNNTPAEPDVLFPAIQDAGYPQLSITYRNDEGQPADPSGYFQYGETEWEDVRGAVEYATANGAEELVFMGYSTGASHVLSYVFQHQLDEVAGVVTDSANIDLGSTIDFRASQEELPLIPVRVPPTMAWVAKFFTSLRIDINWKSIDYIEKASRSLMVPVLSIYGTDDQSVPNAQSIDLAAAQPDLVQLLEVDGAGHVQSFDVDYQGYVDRVLEFLDEVS
jgi:pimeloyl-ACP methyl ester carboxylesterase